MIGRLLEAQLQQRWDSGKALVVMGPRQVGKTTLLTKLCQEAGAFQLLNADEADVRNQLENASLPRLRQLIGNSQTLFIDEAQRVRNIGLTLKLITDQLPQVRLLVSGSSSLDLANEINEPLTGRKFEFRLYPIAWKELVDSLGFMEAHRQLETRLLYGFYPDVVTHLGDERAILQQLSGSYLYKDILTFGGIRRPELLDKLLVALALQVGAEVSYNELARTLQIDRATVESYISLLEKAFIVFRLQPFSRNLRHEISSSRKIYFYDNGIRNAILADFKPLSLRADVGALWENFLVSERQKVLHYTGQWARSYFWRTHQQQEIDYLEEQDGAVCAWEFKWNPKAKARFPKPFLETYTPTQTLVIHRDNFDEFVGA
ncbi:ATP-binding protein [Fibrella aquatilis]|uniref:ATP-binding protein n=1 Tax=Fibrella aquatilis TaxID=2817059 RepID=A0A939G4A6_9BACT|nr:ATP-binding protein [Fibrella aquatilis]MBO0930165.1 ATP-binding protein [Fibrella aquatilis]